MARLDLRQNAYHLMGRLPIGFGYEHCIGLANCPQAGHQRRSRCTYPLRSRPCIGSRQQAPAWRSERAGGVGHKRERNDAFVIPHRTRRHRADKGQPLTVEESDKAVRLVRVHTLAEETFGNAGKAHRWLRRPLRELDGNPPLMLARTDAGARMVETILGKIAWGAAA